MPISVGREASQELERSRLAIAVDPRNRNRVYVAWCDGQPPRSFRSIRKSDCLQNLAETRLCLRKPRLRSSESESPQADRTCDRVELNYLFGILRVGGPSREASQLCRFAANAGRLRIPDLDVRVALLQGLEQRLRRRLQFLAPAGGGVVGDHSASDQFNAARLTLGGSALRHNEQAPSCLRLACLPTARICDCEIFGVEI